MRTTTIAVGLLAAVLLVGGCGSDSTRTRARARKAATPRPSAATNPARTARSTRRTPAATNPARSCPVSPSGARSPTPPLTTDSTSGCGSGVVGRPGRADPRRHRGRDHGLRPAGPGERRRQRVCRRRAGLPGRGSPSVHGSDVLRRRRAVERRDTGDASRSSSNGTAYCDEPDRLRPVQGQPRHADGRADDRGHPAGGGRLRSSKPPSMSEPPSDGTE